MGAGEVGEGISVGTGISVGEDGCPRDLVPARTLVSVATSVGTKPARGIGCTPSSVGCVGELGAGRDLTTRCTGNMGCTPSDGSVGELGAGRDLTVSLLGGAAGTTSSVSPALLAISSTGG